MRGLLTKVFVGLILPVATYVLTSGDVALVCAIRERVAFLTPNSAVALQEWLTKPDAYDAWLIWNIWQMANPSDADIVEVEEPFRI